MFLKSKSKGARHGFTLIELLVVIAIIGILASVVLASLNSARRKSRDARRLADIKQIQVALELYFDSNANAYPVTAGWAAAISTSNLCSGAPCISAVPNDPNAVAYVYERCSTTSYMLSGTLEETGNVALTNDLAAAPTGCTGSIVDPIYNVSN